MENVQLISRSDADRNVKKIKAKFYVFYLYDLLVNFTISNNEIKLKLHSQIIVGVASKKMIRLQTLFIHQRDKWLANPLRM